MNKTLACVLGILVAVVVASPAEAGGNWIETRRRSLRVGATVTARAVFFTRSKAKVLRNAPYFAYLAPEGSGWGLPDPRHRGAIKLGRVEILWPEDHDFRGMLRHNPRARITFEVPAVPVGRYLLAFCDRRCQTPLADVDPTGSFYVVRTAAEGRLRERVGWLKERLREKRYDIRQLRSRLDALVVERDVSERRADEARSRSHLLATRLARARDPDRTPPWWLIPVALAVVASLLRVRSSRRKRSLDDELRELLRSQPRVETREPKL